MHSKKYIRKTFEGAIHVRRFVTTFFLFLGLFATMAIGYYLIEGYSVYQSWLAFISHNGTDWFGGDEAITGIPAQTVAGKMFSSFTALASIAIGGYFISVLTSFIVDGQLKEYFKISGMDKAIEKLSNHYIVCGADDTTREILEELVALKKDVVVVYNDRSAIEAMRQNVLYLDADPTDDESLIHAGIERAAGFVASLNSDQDNLYLVISARSLNQKLKIIAKVFDDAASAKKLRKAGADEVVSPFHIGGLRVASLLVRPDVVTFLDKMIKGRGTYRFEQFTVSSGSSLKGKPLGESHIHEKTGLQIIAVQPAGQSDEIEYNPAPGYTVKTGDTLIVIGTPEQIEKLKKL